MKLLYIVIDGVADNMEYTTSLEAAYTPNLDFIAESGVCGLMYTLGRGIAPESDVAVFSILGYNPHEYYTGRGPLEALGSGFTFREGYEVAFRANFATVNPETLEIIDRRVGRSLEKREAIELARALDGLELDSGRGYVRVAHTVGHRGVVVIGSNSVRLSDNISNTDPAYVRVGRVSTAKADTRSLRIAECKALDRSLEAKYTAELVNEFTRKAVEILRKHPVNARREEKGLLPANAIILRDPGSSIPKPPKFYEVYKLKIAAIAEMPVEIGIFRVLGLTPITVSFESTSDRLDFEAREVVRLLRVKEYDGVYVHIKGPDEPGHDGDFERKVEIIEEIDRKFVKHVLDSIDSSETSILVTSDHATPYTAKSHTDDPVPVALYSKSLSRDSVRRFSERECKRGRLKVIDVGWKLLPTVLKIVKVV